MGPKPAGIDAIYPTATPMPVSWFGPPGYEPAVHKAIEARIKRWEARMAAFRAGAPMLTPAELGAKIEETLASLRTAGPTDAAVLAVQLEDMTREYQERTYGEDDFTHWPRATVQGSVVTEELPA